MYKEEIKQIIEDTVAQVSLNNYSQFVSILKELITIFIEDNFVHKSQVSETIICAAIQTVEGKIVRGHRHHDCIKTAFGMKLTPDTLETQGFITSTNRFVTREQAYYIQKAAGIESACGGYRGNYLYSEDLY